MDLVGWLVSRQVE